MSASDLRTNRHGMYHNPNELVEITAVNANRAI